MLAGPERLTELTQHKNEPTFLFLFFRFTSQTKNCAESIFFQRQMDIFKHLLDDFSQLFLTLFTGRWDTLTFRW